MSTLNDWAGTPCICQVLIFCQDISMEAIESFAKFNIPFIEEEDTSPHDVRSPNGSRWPQPVFRRDSSADERSDSDGSNSVSNPTKFDVKPSNYLNPLAIWKETTTCEQLRLVLLFYKTMHSFIFQGIYFMQLSSQFAVL